MVLINPSKASHCISYNLLLAKIEANLLKSYLSGKATLLRLTGGSINRTSAFNIFLMIYYQINECNFTDNDTLYNYQRCFHTFLLQPSTLLTKNFFWTSIQPLFERQERQIDAETTYCLLAHIFFIFLSLKTVVK